MIWDDDIDLIHHIRAERGEAMTSITMFDSTELSRIPTDAQAVAGYVGGSWATYPKLATLFPKAKRVSIAVNSSEDADVLDIETGDATPEDAPAWIKRQEKLGKYRPCLYIERSNATHLLLVLSIAKISREQIRLWVADWTGVPHICGPSEGLATTSDATQYTDKALGRNLDVSLCAESFFAVKPAPKPPNLIRPRTWFPKDEAEWETKYDTYVKSHKHSPVQVLKQQLLLRKMVARRKLIYHLAAASGGWLILNRKVRYDALYVRTEK